MSNTCGLLSPVATCLKKELEHSSMIIKARSKTDVITSSPSSRRVRIALWTAEGSTLWIPYRQGKQVIMVLSSSIHIHNWSTITALLIFWMPSLHCLHVVCFSDLVFSRVCLSSSSPQVHRFFSLSKV